MQETLDDCWEGLAVDGMGSKVKGKQPVMTFVSENMSPRVKDAKMSRK